MSPKEKFGPILSLSGGLRLLDVRRTSVLCGLLFIAGSACAGASIAGRVHDVDGRPLKDVAISAEAKAKGYSNDKGKFSLEAGGAAGPVRVQGKLALVV